MQVGKPVEELPDHLHHLLLLKNAELLLEGKEGVLGVLQQQVEMGLARIAVVQFYDILVLAQSQDLYLPHQVLPHLPRVRQSDRLLRQQHPALLLLHQRDKGVRAHPDGPDLIEKESFPLGRVAVRCGLREGLRFLLFGRLLQHVLVLVRVTRDLKVLTTRTLRLLLHQFKLLLQGTHARGRKGRKMMGKCILGLGIVMGLVRLSSYLYRNCIRIMDPLIDLPTTSSVLTLPSTLTLLGSEFSPSPQQVLARFEENLSFARSLLASWGLSFGELPYSQQNDRTLRCLVQLGELRQRELQLRGRARDDLAVMQFERDKYHSLLEQAKRSLQEHSKRIGRLENQNAELSAKLRKNELASKREREDDRKAVNMLKTKNQHVLHEIKKKQAEVARLKDQLKKNNQKVALKNGFQVYIHLNPKGKETHNDERFNFLLQRNERDLSMAIQENNILRGIIGDVRQSLLEFSKWIDRQLFGETQNHHSLSQKFPQHHNLAIAKKENLTRELSAMIQSTKDGILQLREISKNHSPPKRKEQPIQQPNFKRKISNRQQAKPQKIIRYQSKKDTKMTVVSKKMDAPHNQNQTPRSSHELRDMRTEPTTKPAIKMQKISLTDRKKTDLLGRAKTISLSSTPKASHQEKQAIFDDEISEVCSNDSSIISHISIEQMGKGVHDRWDILYQDEQ